MIETGFNATKKTLEQLDHMGLKLTFAYHCNRCDHLWFPKDFDVIGENRAMRNIFNLIPPMSCARCKSKQWNKPRKRKIKLPAAMPSNVANDGMLALPRIKAAIRNVNRLMAKFQTVKAEFDKINPRPKQEPAPVIVIDTRKKKKKLEP